MNSKREEFTFGNAIVKKLKLEEGMPLDLKVQHFPGACTWEEINQNTTGVLNTELTPACELWGITVEECWNRSTNDERAAIYKFWKERQTLPLLLPVIFQHPFTQERLTEYQLTKSSIVLWAMDKPITQVALMRMESHKVEGVFKFTNNPGWEYYATQGQSWGRITTSESAVSSGSDCKGLLTLVLEKGSLVFPQRSHAINLSDVSLAEKLIDCTRGFVTVINRSKQPKLEPTNSPLSSIFQTVPTHELGWSQLSRNLRNRLAVSLQEKAVAHLVFPNEYWELATKQQRSEILKDMDSKPNLEVYPNI